MKNPIRSVAEMFVPSWAGGGLRSAFRVVNTSFYPTAPRYDKTAINYDLARQLYRNDGTDSHLGAHFCRPIVDAAVGMIGFPVCNSNDEKLDETINIAIRDFWKPQLSEIFRNTLRDSKCVVRMWQPLLTDPLVSSVEREMCCIEIYEPERVTITYDPRNPNVITEAIIVTKVEFPDPNDNLGVSDVRRSQKAHIKEHEIWEIVTPENYTYYDKTDDKYLTSWGRPNNYGFVPMIEIYNEYDSSLSGGQSEYESVYPFIKAHHETLLKAMQAHSYHSMPKLQFKVQDVRAFLSNNFPSVIDQTTGDVIPGSSISWKGREIMFVQEDEEISFIQADSVLGDSNVLLEFLIDCISIASETPEELFMRTEKGTGGGNDRKMSVFEKKVERKRVNFQPYIQRMIKMWMVMNNRKPEVVEILWPEIRTQTILDLSQALQQLVMSLEVLLERKLISENTARESLSSFRIFHTMKSPDKEAVDAEKNTILAQVMADIDVDAAKKMPKQPALSGTNGNGGSGE